MKLKFAVLAACCFAGSVFAADMSGGMGNGIQGVFIGVNAGQSFFTTDSDAMNQYKVSGTTVTQKKSRLAYGVTVGYWVDPNWGIAVGYDVLGKPSVTINSVKKDASGATVQSKTVTASVNVTDVNVSLLGQTSIYPNLNVFGRLGLAYVMYEQQVTTSGTTGTTTDTPTSASQKDKKFTAILGLGVSYAVTNNVYLTAEYDFIPSLFKKPAANAPAQGQVVSMFKSNLHVIRGGIQFMF